MKRLLTALAVALMTGTAIAAQPAKMACKDGWEYVLKTIPDDAEPYKYCEPEAEGGYCYFGFKINELARIYTRTTKDQTVVGHWICETIHAGTFCQGFDHNVLVVVEKGKDRIIGVNPHCHAPSEEPTKKIRDNFK